jgi:hypothetical protein
MGSNRRLVAFLKEQLHLYFELPVYRPFVGVGDLFRLGIRALDQPNACAESN